MQRAETILGIVHERGTRGLPFNNVYRLLFNPDLYLLAYGKIYRNKGAMTPGATTETVDAMALTKIEAIIQALRTANETKARNLWSPSLEAFPSSGSMMRSLSIILLSFS